MAFAAVAAIIAGAEITATLAVAAIGEIGLATTVVGAVTGNKTLLKIGGVMSLAAGAAGLVNGALSEGASASGWVSAEGGAGYAEGAAADAAAGAAPAAVPSAVDLHGTQTYGLDPAEGVTQAATAQPGVPVPDGVPPVDPSAPYQPTVQDFGGEQASYQTSASAAPTSASSAMATPADTGANIPGTPADQVMQTPASTGTPNPYDWHGDAAFDAKQAAGIEPAKYADWHGDAGYSATPWQQAKGAGYATWDTAIGKATDTNTFLGKVNAVGDWIESHKMAAFLGGQALKGIADSRQADRLYGLKKDQLAIDKERQYNSSHTTPMRYVPTTGIVNSQRA